MSQLTFESFTKKIYIKAPITKLYYCWATSDGICQWFLRKAAYVSADGNKRAATEFVKKDDTYTWGWHNWDDEESGKILEANGRDRITFTFAGRSKVTVQLKEDQGAVLVTLRQYEIPTDDESKLNIHFGCSNGWTFWLANLKAFLEHGILLNETEIDLRAIPLSGFEFVNM